MIEVPLLARWFLGEAVSTRQWLGIGVTLAGIVISQHRGSPRPGNGSVPALPHPRHQLPGGGAAVSRRE
jgi:drug/metabolite transporter (DMT)-like permease